ncbi:COMM domain-containing protein 2 [Parasteatoda tepidariorum]|uniref:COMM domain-containing protein 2 n=1 Tax=Parasteatoda tepidariorum TaxID=114398 RepID=UPI001C72686A|nr:COMM domain-containing protein 2 [Parasteatoda tepidariorum]
MLLLLDDIHKKHLELLKNIDEKIVREFCRISVEHLRNNINPKIYQSAAQRLNIDVDLVQNAIIGVVQLLIEASKNMVDEIEFRDSILVLGFSSEIQEELTKCYLENNESIRSHLYGLDFGIPQYHDLEWRLDIQIASRSLRRPVEPTLLLGLQLKKDGKITNTVLESDSSNIIHLTEELDKALQEVKSHHSRRIMRSIK